MGTLHAFSDTPMRPSAAGMPLAPCNAGPTPDWSLVRLSEDRFLLSLAADGMTGRDVTVRIEGGLLRIDGQAMHYQFLLLEPLQLIDYRPVDARLIVELGRDHATPCRAVIPPRLHEAAALALAA